MYSFINIMIMTAASGRYRKGHRGYKGSHSSGGHSGGGVSLKFIYLSNDLRKLHSTHQSECIFVYYITKKSIYVCYP